MHGGYNRRLKKKLKNNPIYSNKEVGESLYASFTGNNPDKYYKLNIKVPSTLLQIGKCDGILYETVRDGEVENYIHRFKRSARPHFCVSHDGNQIVIVGGKFKFTERGIVDN
jgi:hypothetical protein